MRRNKRPRVCKLSWKRSLLTHTRMSRDGNPMNLITISCTRNMKDSKTTASHWSLFNVRRETKWNIISMFERSQLGEIFHQRALESSALNTKTIRGLTSPWSGPQGRFDGALSSAHTQRSPLLKAKNRKFFFHIFTPLTFVWSRNGSFALRLLSISARHFFLPIHTNINIPHANVWFNLLRWLKGLLCVIKIRQLLIDWKWSFSCKPASCGKAERREGNSTCNSTWDCFFFCLCNNIFWVDLS